MNAAMQPPRRADGLDGWGQALLNPALPVPDGLTVWHGGDPARRFAVYRNNVVTSLQGVLADLYPVVRSLVGPEFFSAMAQHYIMAHPPRSAVMTEYGGELPQWLSGFEPAEGLPYLPDVARLEWWRVQAYHAADAQPLSAAALSVVLAEPNGLPDLALTLHPSVHCGVSPFAAASLWAAHQHDELHAIEQAVAAVPLEEPQGMVVVRDAHDAVQVLPMPPADAAFVALLAQGWPLGVALAEQTQADVAGVLAVLLQYDAVVGWRRTTGKDLS